MCARRRTAAGARGPVRTLSSPLTRGPSVSCLEPSLPVCALTPRPAPHRRNPLPQTESTWDFACGWAGRAHGRVCRSVRLFLVSARTVSLCGPPSGPAFPTVCCPSRPVHVMQGAAVHALRPGGRSIPPVDVHLLRPFPGRGRQRSFLVLSSGAGPLGADLRSRVTTGSPLRAPLAPPGIRRVSSVLVLVCSAGEVWL